MKSLDNKENAAVTQLLKLLVTKLDLIDKKVTKEEKVPTVDYTFVNEIAGRNKLVEDNLKMISYFASDFDKYCKYVHYQVEYLLDYYYHSKLEGKLNKIKIHFATDNSNVTKISDLYFAIKLADFIKTARIDNQTKDTLFQINYVRNLNSHRTLEYSDNIEELFRKAERLKKTQITQQKDWDIINQVNHIKFREAKDFNEVNYSLNSFASSIKKELAKIQS